MRLTESTLRKFIREAIEEVYVKYDTPKGFNPHDFYNEEIVNECLMKMLTGDCVYSYLNNDKAISRGESGMLSANLSGKMTSMDKRTDTGFLRAANIETAKGIVLNGASCKSIRNNASYKAYYGDLNEVLSIVLNRFKNAKKNIIRDRNTNAIIKKPENDEIALDLYLKRGKLIFTRDIAALGRDYDSKIATLTSQLLKRTRSKKYVPEQKIVIDERDLNASLAEQVFDYIVSISKVINRMSDRDTRDRTKKPVEPPVAPEAETPQAEVPANGEQMLENAIRKAVREQLKEHIN